jgi:hypothetical protein
MGCRTCDRISLANPEIPAAPLNDEQLTLDKIGMTEGIAVAFYSLSSIIYRYPESFSPNSMNG